MKPIYFYIYYRLNSIKIVRVCLRYFKIRDEFDITILLIEHDMKFVNKLCDRVMVLDYGKTIFDYWNIATVGDSMYTV